MPSTLYVAVLLAVPLVVVSLWKRHKKPLIPFPPGPRTDPIIGHGRVFPRSDPHLELMRLAKQYGVSCYSLQYHRQLIRCGSGDVMFFNVFGKNIVVLSSQEAATCLLEKRSAIYSSRPELVTFGL